MIDFPITDEEKSESSSKIESTEKNNVDSMIPKDFPLSYFVCITWVSELNQNSFVTLDTSEIKNLLESRVKMKFSYDAIFKVNNRLSDKGILSRETVKIPLKRKGGLRYCIRFSASDEMIPRLCDETQRAIQKKEKKALKDKQLIFQYETLKAIKDFTEELRKRK